ncbi:HNH endonuclease [Streptomyces phage Forrest]|nr:HNH endonuclease [Streptomyces phage Forrest]QZE11531.1 HNH endonuclease [Streptomyces phage Jada]
MKTCKSCGEEKEFSSFYKDSRRKDGYISICIPCDKEKKKQYYLDNKEKVKEAAVRWQANNNEKVRGYKNKWKRANKHKLAQYKHKRRAQESLSHFTAEEFKELCDAYGNICLRCGEEKPLSVDHVIPLCDGGSNSIDNIQPLCVDCNCIKGRKATDYRELYGTE